MRYYTQTHMLKNVDSRKTVGGERSQQSLTVKLRSVRVIQGDIGNFYLVLLLPWPTPSRRLTKNYGYALEILCKQSVLSTELLVELFRAIKAEFLNYR